MILDRLESARREKNIVDPKKELRDGMLRAYLCACVQIFVFIIIGGGYGGSSSDRRRIEFVTVLLLIDCLLEVDRFRPLLSEMFPSFMGTSPSPDGGSYVNDYLAAVAAAFGDGVQQSSEAGSLDSLDPALLYLIQAQFGANALPMTEGAEAPVLALDSLLGEGSAGLGDSNGSYSVS